MSQPNTPLSDPFVACGRAGHPGFYVHECAPQCESLSLRGSRCDKDKGHPEYHWKITDGAVEVWGL